MKNIIKALIFTSLLFCIILAIYSFVNFDIDKVLSSHNYAINTDINKKSIYIFIYDEKAYDSKKIEVIQNEIINVDIPVNKKIIISFNQNSTILYSWQLINKLDNKQLKLVDKKVLQLPLHIFNKRSGENNDRINFYFKPLAIGSQSLNYVYKRNTPINKNDIGFNLIINLNVK